MSVELTVPEVGESITEVQLGRCLKQAGQQAGKDEPLLEIETDKVTLELAAPIEGVVARWLKHEGDTAEVGEVIGYMESNGAAGTHKPAKPTPVEKKSSAQKQPGKPPAPDSSPAPAPTDIEPKPQAPRATPVARRLLEEHDLDPGDIRPTGPGGRISREDVERHIGHKKDESATQPQEPAPADGPASPRPEDASEWAAQTETAAILTRRAVHHEPQTVDRESGETGGDRLEEVVAMTPLRKRIAQRLVQARQNTAMLTTFNEVDMTAVMVMRTRYKDAFQKQYDVKLGFMSFFVKASVDALKQYPSVNAQIRGDNLVYRNYYDIGIAIGSGKGLVVPVLRNAHRLSFAEIEMAIGDFTRRVQENRITLEELQGGTFTITNGGVYGSLMSTPILNPPQSGVLGMHAIQQRPVVIDGEVKARPMMYIALTYDHCVIDGREAVSFLKRIKDTIEEPSRMLIEI